MNSLLYWFLFSSLISLLIIFASYLLINIIWDFFVRPKRTESMFLKEERRHQTLNKHEFSKQDVEDLTRIERNLKTDFPRVSFSNEVKNPFLEEHLKEQGKSVVKENENYNSTDAVNGSLVSISEDEKEYDDSSEEPTQNEETFSLTDPESVEIYRAIVEIEKKAKRVENEVIYFRGCNNDLQYYEINEKCIRLTIALCDLNCENIELRKKKNQVMLFVEKCQNILRLKSHQVY